MTAKCQTHSLLGRLEVLGPGSTVATREEGPPGYLVTNLVTNLSPNLVTNWVITKFVTKFGDDFGDQFSDKFSDHQIW